jgi:hypothetical protein
VDLDAATLPNTPENHHALLLHIAAQTEITAKAVERLEDGQEDARRERRQLEKVARTLSAASLQLLGAKALQILVPPTRLVLATVAGASVGGFMAQIVQIKLGLGPLIVSLAGH